MLSHKAGIDKFQKTEIISSIFSDHKAMKLEINYKKERKKKYTNMRRLNNLLRNDQWITEEIKKEIKKYLQINENENTTIQNLCKSSKQFSEGRLQQIKLTSGNKKNLK